MSEAVQQYGLFLAYAVLFRLAVIGGGLFAIVLGYRLISQAVALPTDKGAGDAVAKVLGFELSIRNGTPGAFLVLFGTAAIVTMVVQGNPSYYYKAGGGSTVIRSRGQDDGGQTEPSVVFDDKLREAEGHLAAQRPEVAAATIEVALADRQITRAQIAKALNELAVLRYQAADRVNEAAALVSIANRLDPENADYLDTEANIALKQGRNAAAESAARRAVALRPASAAFHETLARILEAGRRLDEARAEFEGAAGLDGRYGPSLTEFRQRHAAP